MCEIHVRHAPSGIKPDLAKREKYRACGKGRAPSGVNTGLAGRTGRKALPLAIALRQAEIPQRWQVSRSPANACLSPRM